MKSLAQVLPPEIRQRLAGGEEPGPDDGQPLSECSCRLPAGCWGKNGWHLRKTTPAEVGLAFKDYYMKQFEDLDPRRQQEEWAAWVRMEKERGRMDEAGVHKAWKLEAGRTVYYQRCPQKQARRQEEQRQMKLNDVTTRGGKSRLD